MQIDLLLLEKSWLMLVCVDQAIELVQFISSWPLMLIALERDWRVHGLAVHGSAHAGGVR